MGKEVEAEMSKEAESCGSSGLIRMVWVGAVEGPSSLQMRGLREWKLRGKKRAAVGEKPGEIPHRYYSLLHLQHPDQIYFKPHGPHLVGLPGGRADVRVLRDADPDLTPVLPLHLCDGVEVSYGDHRCHL